MAEAYILKKTLCTPYIGYRTEQFPLKQDTLLGYQGTRRDTLFYTRMNEGDCSLLEHLAEVTTEEMLLKTQKPTEV